MSQNVQKVTQFFTDFHPISVILGDFGHFLKLAAEISDKRHPKFKPLSGFSKTEKNGKKKQSGTKVIFFEL